MRYGQREVSVFSLLYLVSFLFTPLNAQTTNQAPAAEITAAATVVLAGSTVQLDGTASSDPENETLIYSWKLVRTPSYSTAALTTPSPSMPSFVAEREGLYVVELIVSDGENLSEPEYVAITAATPAGSAALAAQPFSTSSLCALSEGLLGCSEETKNFAATAGDYTLNVEGANLSDLSITLNSQALAVPFIEGVSSRFSIPVSLEAQNELKVTLKGAMGSFARMEIVENSLLSGMNAAPVVADLSLEASNMMRAASGAIVVTDSDAGQTHSFEILNESQYGEASIMGNFFQYVGEMGFKGKETFALLTYDNGTPTRGTVSKVSVDVTFNTGPMLALSQSYNVPTENNTFSFQLASATDLENDPLTYSLVSMPTSGSLTCANRGNTFHCTYTLPSDFSGSVSFSYKANDGQLDSNASVVVLKAVTFSSPIAQMALGSNHSCLVNTDGKVRCWGDNSSSKLGYRNFFGHLGDNESPLAQGYLEITQRIVKVSAGPHSTCALTDTGKVRCWGSGGAILGFVPPRHTFPPFFTPEEGIDFGTNLRVVDIVSQLLSSCALFEHGRVKCWGRGGLGILGYGRDYINVGGIGLSLSDLPYLQLGGKVISLAASKQSAAYCAVLEGGSVRCWGKGETLGLIPNLGNQNIGDDEHPDAFATLPLSGPAEQVAMSDNHACALLSSGEIQCWGFNRSGELGLGHDRTIAHDENFNPAEITVPLDRKAIKIVAGQGFTCALLDNSTVRCWGTNHAGQLGIGRQLGTAIGDDELPTSVPAISFSDAVIDIEAGFHHTCALLISGSLKCWGSNFSGQLGLGHSNTIGDDEAFESFQDSDVGGFSRIYPRLAFLPQLPFDSQSIEFNAQNSISRIKVKSYAWDFGDGTTVTERNPTHSFSSPGVYNVGLTITDTSDNDISTDQLVWVRSSLGHAPDMPGRQFFTVEQNRISKLDLLPAWDNEGDPITYSLETMPALQGTLANCLGGTGSLACHYTPPQDFTGTIKFSYRANDGHRDSLETTEVEIHVVNEANTIIDMAMGFSHNCALFDNKQIKCWGTNEHGQLGLGTSGRNSIHQGPLSNLPFVNVGGNVEQVVVGGQHTCAVLEGGTLKCWGSSALGILTSFSGIVSNPSTIPPLGLPFPVKQVSLGRNRTCVVGVQGQLTCWGSGLSEGVLGLGTQGIVNLGDSPLETPEKFPLVDVGGKVAKVEVGSSNICALLENGNVRCWGSNFNGSLGLGPSYQSNPIIGDNETPGSVPPISLGKKAIDVVVGTSSSCALLEDQTVRCWGRGLGYDVRHPPQIGDDEHPSSIPPLDFGGLKAVRLSFSGSHICVILEDESVRCTGSNVYGAFGDPVLVSNRGALASNIRTFHPILHLEGITDLFTGANHTCALFKDGDARCWGRNDFGQLALGHTDTIGDDEYPNEEYAPTFRAGQTLIARFGYAIDDMANTKVHFSASDSFVLNGVKNYKWNFGDGNTSTDTDGEISHTFAQTGSYRVTLTVTDLFDQTSDVSQIVNLGEINTAPFLISKQEFSVAKGRKEVFRLQSAFDTENTNLNYFLVSAPSQGSLSGCLGIGGSSGTVCTYTAPDSFTGKTTFAYRANDGDLSSDASSVEIKIVEPHLVPQQLAAKQNHACALYRNKKIKCWGRNNGGQLGLAHTRNIGNDELISSQDFVDVGGEVLQVEVGIDHTCVLLTDKKVKCWGANYSGQLGRGIIVTIGDGEFPSSIESLDLGETVKQIALGVAHSCALTESGRVKCWGANYWGQLGLGHTNTIGDNEVVSSDGGFVPLAARALKISAGDHHTCALLKEGRVRCWGGIMLAS